MSVTTAIENISNHLKNAYDELQGLGADLTNVNKNIENISMVLDDIYDSMPQVSGEGTSLTLDNTRVGKIKSTLKGNTSQDGIPTPTTPIPINVVSGDNEINVTGYNLLDFSGYPQESKVTVNNDGTVTLNGAGGFALNFKEIDVIQGTTYSTFAELVSGTITGSLVNGTGLMSPLGKNNWLSDNTQDIYTPNENKKRHSIWVGDQGTYNNAKFRIWAYVGSTPLPYEPYQDSNTYNIDLGVENLWDTSKLQSGYLNQSGSYPTTNPSYPNARYRLVYLYKGQSITTYKSTLHGDFRMRYIDVDTNLIVGTVAVGDNGGYCSSNVTYQGGFNNGTVTALKDVILGLFDYSGNLAEATITYGTKIQAISPTPIELCKVPNANYEDTLLHDKVNDKWYWHREIWKVVLNGSEDINTNSSYINGGRFDIMNYTNGIKGSASLPGAISDYFVGAFNINNGSVFLSSLDSHINVINTSYSENLAGFKIWLSTHNVTIYYILATPINIEITYQPLIDQLNELEKAQSKENQTNISQVNNDLPFIIKANALLQIGD